MKPYLITIDGGTTNTRAVLWNRQGTPVLEVKSQFGVKKSAQEGNNESLKREVHRLLEELLECTNVSYDAVSAVYACGMLTSNVGLCEVPHLTAPAGISDFAEQVKTIQLEDVCPLPIHFLPGLKNKENGQNLEQISEMDMMRGEEAEMVALLSLFLAEEDTVFVLPGSHTKFVAVNGQGQMTGCLTSLAGELLEVLTNYTVLSDAVDCRFAPAAYNREMLLAGCHSTWSSSLTRAAFLTRIVNQFISRKEEDCASFLLGAVLADDIRALKHAGFLGNVSRKIRIAGKEPLQSALRDVFLESSEFPDVQISELDVLPPLSGYGLYLIAKMRNDI